DACRLMQCRPPVHRELADWNVHRTNEGKNGHDTASTQLIIERTPERDQTEIAEQHDQGGGHATIPFPERAPSRATPHGAGEQRKSGEQGSEWRSRLHRYVSHRVTPDEGAQRRNG